jgi:tetratricopeptide (TPR) repeat protein
VKTRHHKFTSRKDSPASADLRKIIEEWVRKRFGVPGIVVLAALLVLGGIWWKWDDVSKVPGIAELVRLFSQEKLPHGDPDRFSIAVAHLDGDTNGDDEKLLVDALQRFGTTDSQSSLSGLKILRFDRTIELNGGDPELAASRGHETARRLLNESGTDVLLWGTVLRVGTETRARLFWTANSVAAHGKATDLYAVQFELPKVFWKDMTQWLGLLVESQAAELQKMEGQYAVGRLKPFIERSRKILATADWDTDAQGKMRVMLAYALRTYGEQSGISQPLEEAIGDLEEALKERTRERVPLEWAATQNNHGLVLYDLGRRQANTAKLEAAVAAYQEALKERTRERVPLDWAVTQHNLGTALYDLGRRQADTAKLEAAVAAYQEALKEWTREQVPLDWAVTENNLGLALDDLGRRQADTAKLEAAVAAYQEALKERTRERVPRDWAATQNNLGSALDDLGRREVGIAKLEVAVAAYREALKERTREWVPLDWAATQNNLGSALDDLGRREAGTAKLEAAVAAYQEALKERTRERVPLDWAATQNNLGNALYDLGRREAGTAKLETAVAAYQEALKVWHGPDASMAQENLDRAQTALAKMRANQH